ncbi:CHAP domain-containing protein [Staphylococcus warneri]
MKKSIVWMLFITISLTLAAIFDGLNNQDMTEPKNHLFDFNPMKYNTYQKGQCTYYVFDKVREDHHQIANSWHDAKDWAKNAKKDQYKVNQHPKEGSILQTTAGKYGHVAYIEKVNEDQSLYISEMNFKKPYEISNRTIPANDVDQYQYIHPKENQHIS